MVSGGGVSHCARQLMRSATVVAAFLPGNRVQMSVGLQGLDRIEVCLRVCQRTGECGALNVVRPLIHGYSWHNCGCPVPEIRRC